MFGGASLRDGDNSFALVRWGSFWCCDGEDAVGRQCADEVLNVIASWEDVPASELARDEAVLILLLFVSALDHYAVVGGFDCDLFGCELLDIEDDLEWRKTTNRSKIFLKINKDNSGAVFDEII